MIPDKQNSPAPLYVYIFCLSRYLVESFYVGYIHVGVSLGGQPAMPLMHATKTQYGGVALIPARRNTSIAIYERDAS